MLLPLLIHAEALEGQIPPGSIVWFHGPGQEKRALHRQILHPILHHAQLDRDDPRHLNGAAKGDFPIALGKVQVPNAEFGAGNVDGEVDFAATAKVFNIAVATVLRAAGDGARAFFPNLLFDFVGGAACVDALGQRGKSDNSFEVGGADELAFTTVPLRKDFR